MGAPLGNNNRGKNKEWRDALKRAVARVGSKQKGDGTAFQKGMNLIAEQLVEAANNGDSWALKEIGDRIDGKPAQQQILTGIDDGPIQTEEIKPRDTAREIAFLLRKGEQEEVRH